MVAQYNHGVKYGRSKTD